MKPLILGLLLSSLAATAQTAPVFTASCQERRDNHQPGFCETRDLTLPAPAAGQPLTIDGGANGGISVRGWDGPDVRVRVTVQAQAKTPAEAQARGKAVRIDSQGNKLSASVAQNTSVSYEVFVPRRTSLVLSTQNGGIDLANLRGMVSFRTQNGGVALTDLGGQVTGKTINGGLAIRLGGSQWEGTGLDVEAVNGGISWHVPADYSAQLETSTDNGSLRTTLPQSPPRGNRHEVKTTLGKGGQLLKATTANGGVVIQQG